MTDVQLRVYSPDNQTFIGTLTNAFGRQFVDAHNDHGAGSFSVDLDDDQLSLIQPRRVIRWRIDGTDRFASYVDDRPRVIYTPDERPALKVEGPGLAGWLGAGKGGAIVWPVYTGRTRATARHFGWASHGFDISGWNEPATLGRQAKPASALPRLVGEPPDWPDGNAEWLWGNLLTQEGGRAYHNAGFVLFKRNLPPMPEGPARIYIAGTNDWTLYYDGEEIGTGGGFRSVSEFDVHIPNQAPTPIAAIVSKVDNPEFQYDPGLFLLTVRRLDSEGQPARHGTVARTYTTTIQSHLPVRWRSLLNPDPVPGVTPGKVLQTLVDEAKGRGALPGLSYDFTATLDSNGEPWTIDTINESFDIGTQLYTVLSRLSQDYGVEWYVGPSGMLQVFNARGLTQLGALGPFASGGASGEGVRATRILGRSADGYRERTLDPLGVGHVEDFLDLGGIESRHGMDPHLDRRLETSARESDEFDFELSATSPVPYVEFDVGDEYDDGRVTQIAMTQDDDNGAVRWAVSLRPTG